MARPPLAYRPHNHDACIDAALDHARALCQQRNARLTAIRERVLTLVWQSHRPLGAYDLLAELARQGQHAAPPTVYRALEFLQQYGLVHRIASLNAFVGCSHAGERHRGMFLICRQCRNVLELTAPPVNAAVEAAAGDARFQAEDVTLEVSGLCPACQTEAADD